MNEEPKGIWKKSWTGRNSLVLLAGLCIAGIFLAGLIYALADWQKPVVETFTGAVLIGVIIVTGCLVVIYVCLPLMRFLFWKNRRRALASLIWFTAFIALFYAVEDWRGWQAWENFRHEWEANGERFDLASVVPPVVPDEKNFARTPVVASSYAWLLDKDGCKLAKPDTNAVNRLDIDLADDYGHRVEGDGSWAKGTLTDLKPRLELFAARTNLFPLPPRSASPATGVLLALGKFDSTVEELRTAATLPESRFPLEYNMGCPAAILLPHLAPLKKASRLLQLRAIAELQNGESEKALADVNLMLRLADSVRGEPFLISHLVRIAILQIALQPVYEGLAEHRWSDAQLAELDTLLARQNFLADYRTAMRGEMVLLQIGCIQWLRRNPEEIGNLGGNFDNGKTSEPKLPGKLIARAIPSGWFYQNQYRCVRMTLEYFLPVVDVKQGTVSPALVLQSEQSLHAETKRTNPYNILEKMLMPALAGAVKKFAYGQAAVNLARTAIALERYRLAHGDYPETLDALAPAFISTVPHDVIDGGPLKYRREADGNFVLYSVGWNETDDGGTLVFKKGSSPEVDISEGDWGWRYPMN